jgi:hypothetical protein
MCPYRTKAEVPEPGTDVRAPHDWEVFAILFVIGAIRVLQAFLYRETWRAEASVAMMLVLLAAYGLIWGADPRRSRR